MNPKKKAAPGANRAASGSAFDKGNRTPPTVTGQCAMVLQLIRQKQPVLSFTLTADNAIPEAAARVHDLRAMGFNILTTIHPAIVFRGVVRRNVASYSLGSPEWPRPGFSPTPCEAIEASGVAHAPSESLASWAECIKRSADSIAAGMCSIPPDEKEVNRVAILRGLRDWLILSRAGRRGIGSMRGV